MDADNQRSTPAVDRFLGAMARSLIHGILAAIASFLVFYLITAMIWDSGITHVNPGTIFFMATLSAAYIAAVAGVALIVIGPASVALAWWPYRRGVRSYFVYVVLGAMAALSAPLLFAVSAFDLAVLFSPMGLWFAFSGAVGGWSFAKQLRHEHPGI